MKKKKVKVKKLSEDEIDTFEKLQSQLEALHTEIGTLSKKAQNDAINQFKLKLINKILEDTNILLGEDYMPFPDFAEFDEDELPTNSDVTFIVSQYLGCVEKLRVDNTFFEYGRWYWEGSERETYPPKKLKK